MARAAHTLAGRGGTRGPMARARRAALAVPAASATARDPGEPVVRKDLGNFGLSGDFGGLESKSPSSPNPPRKSALRARLPGLAGRMGVAGRGCTPLPVRRSRGHGGHVPRRPRQPGTAGPVAHVPGRGTAADGARGAQTPQGDHANYADTRLACLLTIEATMDLWSPWTVRGVPVYRRFHHPPATSFAL
jgi:hypothetical protein